jgi:hypothetical protein
MPNHINDPIKKNIKDEDCPPICEPTWKKFTRPGSFIVTLIFYFAITLLDGNYDEFTVKDIYVHILETILLTQITFLFTTRSVEKVVESWNRKKDKKQEYDFEDD